MTGVPTLLHGLAGWVDARPRATALVTCGRETSYAELWSAVRRAAGALRDAGVDVGDRVVLVLPNCPSYVAAYYGTLAAGAVVVPLNDEGTPDELSAAITHCGARAVIISDRWRGAAELRGQLPGEVHVLPVSDVRAAREASIDLSVPASDTLAAILYTSGTTARPKGVMLSHRNLVANTEAIIRYLGLTPDDRVLAALPFPYAYGNSVLHTHLLAGASLAVEHGMMYPQKTLEVMRTARVSGFSGVPWMYRLLLERTSFARAAGDLPDLRYLTQAGGPMRRSDIVAITAAFPRVPFFAMYGQTEACARLTYLPPAALADRPGSVGVPIDGVQIDVRRADGTRAPASETGEIVARGPNVMLGYWNDQEATRAVLHDEPTGRWLRTGDLGYVDEAGYLFLVGRSSEIIKTAGHRVSPGEVEEVVMNLDGVAEAAVCGVPDAGLDEAILLVVVPQKGHTLTEQDLLAHCRRHLSAFKWPRRVVFASSLPRTPSGKVRRRHLRSLVDTGVHQWAS
jgi:acyl-CoA synthetase (AMP-forming)/AMP-acid ligase II